MGKYQDITKNILWGSLGKDTVAAKVGLSLVPVGILPFQPLPPQPNGLPASFLNESNLEQWLMNIVGTAIQAGDGKLVTCAHVVEELIKQKRKGYILTRFKRDGTVICIPYPIYSAIRYVDPRTDEVNPNVDMAVLIVPAKSTKEIPYETPNVCWGDSSRLGVGDQVVLGGYPYGKQMFLFTQSNRGIVQPTFYSGIVSAILPATKPYETRIIQVSIPCGGGMSGGALFDANTGDVMGMVTSGVNIADENIDVPLPMTYALPSEIIAPFAEVIRFERAKDKPQ